MNRASKTYQFLQKVLSIRKNYNVYEKSHQTRYSDEQVYVWSRGKILIAVTNNDYFVQKDITNHPFEDGDTVCNLLYKGDKQRIIGGSLNLMLSQGESKIFVSMDDDDDDDRRLLGDDLVC